VKNIQSFNCVIDNNNNITIVINVKISCIDLCRYQINKQSSMLVRKAYRMK